MNRIILSLFFLAVFQFTLAQEIDNGFQAFDTNGPMGECLFPTNNQYQETFECDKTKSEIIEGVENCFTNLITSANFKCKINNVNNTGSIYTCNIQIYLGDVCVEVPFVGYINKQFSELEYDIKVEAKDNKYRVSFYNFHTDRMTLRGDAKSNGQSNLIHWQRINSLSKERAKTSRKKKIAEYDEMIAREEEYYKLEWQSVLKVMDALKHCTEDADF